MGLDNQTQYSMCFYFIFLTKYQYVPLCMCVYVCEAVAQLVKYAEWQHLLPLKVMSLIPMEEIECSIISLGQETHPYLPLSTQEYK
jgi:hypothetical protein